MTILETWLEPMPIKLTIADFLHLDQTGAFHKYAKTELIGGTIVAMNAQYSTHARVKSLLFRRLADAVDSAMPEYDTWTEVSVAIPPIDMPEPDIVVTNFQAEHRSAVPVETISLIVEIADTTVRYDLGEKAILYAGAGVPEYWVADIAAAQVHQFWQPTENGYGKRHTHKFGERLEAITLPLAIIIPE